MNQKQYKAINAYIRRIRGLDRMRYAETYARYLGGLTSEFPNNAGNFGITPNAARDIRIRMMEIMDENPDTPPAATHPRLYLVEHEGEYRQVTIPERD
jgi:hypothetical protein